MPLTLAAIKERVRIIGKDQQNQYSDTITNFIKDTVREITVVKDTENLYRESTIVVDGTWQNLPSDFHKMKGMLSQGDGRRITRIHRNDYFLYRNKYSTSAVGHYLLQHDEDNDLWQVKFVNVASGTTVEYAYKRWMDDVTKVPSFWEEAIVNGAVAKFLKLMEGDDITLALHYENKYIEFANAISDLADADVSESYNRVKTNRELEILEADIHFNDQS